MDLSERHPVDATSARVAGRTALRQPYPLTTALDWRQSLRRDYQHVAQEPPERAESCPASVQPLAAWSRQAGRLSSAPHQPVAPVFARCLPQLCEGNARFGGTPACSPAAEPERALHSGLHLVVPIESVGLRVRGRGGSSPRRVDVRTRTGRAVSRRRSYDGRARGSARWSTDGRRA
jgi:hypothetical protein